MVSLSKSVFILLLSTIILSCANNSTTDTKLTQGHSSRDVLSSDENGDIQGVSKVDINSNSPTSIYLESFKDNKILTTGTGFLVKYRNIEYFITNWHVLTGKETDLRFKHSAPDGLFIHFQKNNLNYRYMLLSNDGWIEYKDVKTNIVFDIAAIPISNELKNALPNNYYLIDTLSYEPNANETYLMHGFPASYIQGGKNIFQPKIIPLSIIPNSEISKLFGINDNASQKSSNIVKFYLFGNFFKHSKEMENGVSGSPIYSQDKRLMGIYSFKFFGESVGYFWSIKSIIRLLDKGKPINWDLINK